MVDHIDQKRSKKIIKSQKILKMQFLLGVFILSLFHTGFAYIITVDSHSEECFFDPASAGSKLGETLKFFH